MVVTALPATSPTAVTQERVATPSTCTVQAPHIAMPQPNLVPVSPSSSRMTQSRGVSSATSRRSEEHTSELQSLMRISYAVFCLKKKNKKTDQNQLSITHYANS